MGVLIHGDPHDLHHLTTGVSPNTVTVFYNWDRTKTPQEPIIWGLGYHVGSDNLSYEVKWDEGRVGKVQLPPQ